MIEMLRMRTRLRDGSVRAALLLLWLALPLQAQEPPPAAADGPRLVVKRTIPFEEVVQGTVFQLKIPVENGGTAPLEVTRVETSCGCALIEAPSAPIPPGGKAELVLRYDSSDKAGAQAVQVLVYSNDPTQADQGRFCTRLLLQGDVRSVYRIAPAGAFFGEVVAGSPASLERTVTITGIDEARAGFEAKLTGQAPPWLDLRLEPLPPAAAGQKPRGVKLHVKLAPDAPRGELSHLAVLETDVKAQPRVRVLIAGLLVGRVVGPESVQLLRARRGERVERRAPLERRDGQGALAVAAVHGAPPWLEVKLERMSSERTDVLVTLLPDAPPGPVAQVLRVVMLDPPGEVLELPVLGQVLPKVRLDPGALVLSPRADGSLASTTLVVRGARVLAATAEPGGDVKLAADGDQTHVTLVGAAERVVLTTDCPGEEKVVVPVLRR